MTTRPSNFPQRPAAAIEHGAGATLAPTATFDQSQPLLRPAARSTWRRLRDRLRDAHQQRRAWREFDSLDERTLRDLGLTRSELRSFVAEADGRSEVTRRRIERSLIVEVSSGLQIRQVDAFLSVALLLIFASMLVEALQGALLTV